MSIESRDFHFIYIPFKNNALTKKKKIIYHWQRENKQMEEIEREGRDRREKLGIKGSRYELE